MRFPEPKENEELWKQLGLMGNGQMRTPYVHKNLWWSFDGGETTFGYGDLDNSDLGNIFAWLSNSEPGHSTMVFTAWNEHHDSDWQQTDKPMIRISKEDGITFPNREARAARR